MAPRAGLVRSLVGGAAAVDPVIAVALWCGIGGLFGAAVGASKSMGAVSGFVVGAIFGILGVIIVAVSPGIPEPSVLDRIQARPNGEGWHPDPLGRFDARWFNGEKWTQHVGRVTPDGGRQSFEDPL